MRLLGIDSSTPECSIALLKNQEILSQATIKNRPSYSNFLLKMVDDVLLSSGMSLSEVDGFAITTGPGSFTGLRVGISLVKGFALSTEKPFRGTSTLEAIAALVPETDLQICPMLDARKSEVYASFFKFEGGELYRRSSDEVVKPEALCKKVTEPTIFLGQGLTAYGELISNKLGSLFVRHETVNDEVTVAASAARIAMKDFENKKSFDLNSLKINYIRKSEAELNFKG